MPKRAPDTGCKGGVLDAHAGAPVHWPGALARSAAGGRLGAAEDVLQDRRPAGPGVSPGGPLSPLRRGGERGPKAVLTPPGPPTIQSPPGNGSNTHQDTTTRGLLLKISFISKE